MIAQNGTMSLVSTPAILKSTFTSGDYHPGPNIEEKASDFPDMVESRFDQILNAIEEGMRKAKEMLDELTQAIEDIKNGGKSESND